MNLQEEAKKIVSELDKRDLSNQSKKRTAVAYLNELISKEKQEISEIEIDEAIEVAYNDNK